MGIWTTASTPAARSGDALKRPDQHIGDEDNSAGDHQQAPLTVRRAQRLLRAEDQQQERGDHGDSERGRAEAFHRNLPFSRLLNCDLRMLRLMRDVQQQQVRLEEAFEKIEETILPCIAMMLETLMDASANLTELDPKVLIAELQTL